MGKAEIRYYSENDGRFCTFPVTGREVLLGRGPENTICLPHDTLVSRKRHAAIFQDDNGEYVVVDLESVNGVFVNGRPVDRQVLKDGDAIRLGRTDLIFTLEDGDDILGKMGIALVPDDPVQAGKTLRDVAGVRAQSMEMPEDMEGLRQAARRLGLINQVSQRLQKETDANRALKFVLESIFEEMYAERAFIAISLSATPDHFDYIETRKLGQKKGTDEIRFSRTLAERILQSDQAVLIGDMLEHVDLRKVGSIAALGVRSVLGISIPGRHGVVGMMYFDSLTEPHVFSEKDMAFLAAISPHIGLAVENILERAALAEQYRRIEDLREMVEKVELRLYCPGCQSRAAREMLDLAHRFAAAPETLLITGETGTGKSFLAHYIHRQSERRHKVFQDVSLTGLSPQIIESELFGHVKGAFTGAHRSRIGLIEEADGGTLFLDEIGDVDMTIQAKLLDFLDNKTFRRMGDNAVRRADVRIVLATNRDLAQEMERGRFRQDLYRRINVLRIHMPPLRERTQDIPELCRYILYRLRLNAKNYPAEGVSEACQTIFSEYDWPGNIGELENAVKTAFYLCTGRVIQPEHLPRNMAHLGEGPREVKGPLLAMRDVEKEHILAVLKGVDNNISEAARQLNISRTTLYKRLRDWGIEN